MPKTFYQETLESLIQYGKKPSDVCWIGTDEWSISWKEFEQIAKRIEISEDYFSPVIHPRLKIVGDDFLLHREEREFDFWRFISLKKPPEVKGISVSEVIS